MIMIAAYCIQALVLRFSLCKALSTLKSDLNLNAINLIIIMRRIKQRVCIV